MLTQGGLYRKKTLQSAAGATGAGESLPLIADAQGGFEMVAVQLTGTFTATVTWQATVDGTNWVNVKLTDLTSGTAAATATAAGISQGNLKGCIAFRANITAYASGAITAEAIAVA